MLHEAGDDTGSSSASEVSCHRLCKALKHGLGSMAQLATILMRCVLQQTKHKSCSALVKESSVIRRSSIMMPLQNDCFPISLWKRISWYDWSVQLLQLAEMFDARATLLHSLQHCRNGLKYWTRSTWPALQPASNQVPSRCRMLRRPQES